MFITVDNNNGDCDVMRLRDVSNDVDGKSNDSKDNNYPRDKTYYVNTV